MTAAALAAIILNGLPLLEETWRCWRAGKQL